MMKYLGVALLASTVCFLPAHAAIGQGNSEVGVDYGSTSYDSNTGLDSSDSIALRGGYFLTDLFQIEGQFASSDANSKDFGADVKASTDLMMVNGVFNFMTEKTITPYALVGLGQAKVSVDQTGLQSTNDSGTAYQIGAGSRFFFGKAKRAAFRLDVSRVTQDNFNEKSTNTTVAGGFSWRLGGK